MDYTFYKQLEALRERLDAYNKKPEQDKQDKTTEDTTGAAMKDIMDRLEKIESHMAEQSKPDRSPADVQKLKKELASLSYSERMRKLAADPALMTLFIGEKED